jgi:sporulation and spore germination protein
MPRRRAARPGRGWWALLLVVLAAAVLAVRWFSRAPAEVDAYFVHFDNARHTGALVSVRRPGPGRDAPLRTRLEAALRALLAGPSAAERRQGTTSEIPAGTALRSVRLDGTTATVDLTSEFARGGGSTSMLARLSQVVYTATQFAQIPQVQLLLDGRRVEALGGEGLLIEEPLRRSTTPPTF